MIKTNNLTKYYGESAAVDNVSFEVGGGEIVGLLGHNGAGKTTVMKMITGYLEPSAGGVTVDGMALTDHRTVIQSKIGYLPENCPAYPELQVIDYLEYAAGLRGLTGTACNEALRYAIRKTELKEKATHTINTLSRGFRQRVGVAQAILNKPEILIMDEPTNGLDPSQIQHMRELITELGKVSTVILSTHILQEVHAICTRVLILRDGKLALDSKLEDLQKGHRLMLAVDKTPDEARGKLSAIAGVQSADFLFSDDNRHHYALNMEPTPVSIDESAAPLAREVIKLGYQLYALYPEKRDLESVFSEINSTEGSIPEGQAHAA